jgi:hypothetical protein
MDTLEWMKLRKWNPELSVHIEFEGLDLVELACLHAFDCPIEDIIRDFGYIIWEFFSWYDTSDPFRRSLRAIGPPQSS